MRRTFLFFLTVCAVILGPIIASAELTSTIHGSLAQGTTNPKPKIEVYLPKQPDRTEIGVVILPGGGYQGLAGHEGKDYAEYLQGQGIAGFVVEYRLGRNGFHHPAMLEDALAAIQTVRNRAVEFGIDPHKVGIMGSSAGGHLTAHTVTAYVDYAKDLRPDFGILCYPVIEMDGAFTHAGSRRNLLGDDPTRELRRSVSPELRVNADTPPCFIWHTADDPVVPVENSMLFAMALQRHGIPFELHVYPHGRHGLGLKSNFGWEDSLVRWLGELFK
ncbi:MAG: alpha/beta hydrolase [Verrucomicrobiae bacterium]|nr:alpha/beta hydrolase [Verrucomicrobiae bacterium]